MRSSTGQIDEQQIIANRFSRLASSDPSAATTTYSDERKSGGMKAEAVVRCGGGGVSDCWGGREGRTGRERGWGGLETNVVEHNEGNE